MSYFISIKTAIIVFPFIALAFSIPFIIHQYHKYGAINPLRVLIIYSFILYMITMYFLVILPLPNKDEVISKPNMVKLVPFGFINDIINESSLVLSKPSTYLKALKEPCFYTVIFNIMMTIPFGMYLRYYFKYSLKKTVFYTFLLSLFFELTQVTGLYFYYPHPYRVFDVDDLITNTLGGLIGYFIMGIIDDFLPTRDEIDDEAYKEGKFVSGLRRITVFCLDLYLYIVLTFLLSIFVNIPYLALIIFLLYYVIYPYLQNGKTIGSSFLGVRLEFNNHRFLKILFRIIFLFIYYIGSIFLVMVGALFITNTMNLAFMPAAWFYLLVLLGIIIFYAINLLLLIINKKMFYDNFFKVRYISTIANDRKSAKNS